MKTKTDVLDDFKKEIADGHIHHATLVFSSSREEGDTFLRQLAQMILCEGNGCREKIPCKACILFNAGSHPDLFSFPKGKNFLVADAQEIISQSQILPMFSRQKVFLLSGMDTATVQAQNKMLKLLEEPPASSIFLLNAVNEESVLRTIVSRCHHLHLPYADKAWTEKQQNMADELCAMLKNMKSSKEVISFSVKFSDKKDLFLEKLEILSQLFGEILHKTRENEGFSEEAVIHILAQIDNTKQKKQQNVNVSLLTDVLLLKILELKFLFPLQPAAGDGN